MNNVDTLGEIIAVASILIKFGFDDILESTSLFMEFLNELGIKINNKRVTPYALNRLINDITVGQKKKLLEEFSKGHEPLYRRLVMVGA